MAQTLAIGQGGHADPIVGDRELDLMLYRYIGQAQRGTRGYTLLLAYPEVEEANMAGTKDKMKGSIKEAAGKVTGDRRTEAEGKTDQAKGEAKNAARDVKETTKGVRDSLKGDDTERR